MLVVHCVEMFSVVFCEHVCTVLYVICKMLFLRLEVLTNVVITVVFKQVIYCLVDTMKTSVI